MPIRSTEYPLKLYFFSEDIVVFVGSPFSCLFLSSFLCSPLQSTKGRRTKRLLGFLTSKLYYSILFSSLSSSPFTFPFNLLFFLSHSVHSSPSLSIHSSQSSKVEDSPPLPSLSPLPPRDGDASVDLNPISFPSHMYIL